MGHRKQSISSDGSIRVCLFVEEQMLTRGGGGVYNTVVCSVEYFYIILLIIILLNMMVVCVRLTNNPIRITIVVFILTTTTKKIGPTMTHLLRTHTHTHGIQHAGSGAADLKLRTTEDTNEAPQEETGQPIQEKVQ